jgi:hypothetical protein
MPNEFPPDDIRNVWQDQPVENTPMPLEEIQRRARRFEKRIDRRNLREYVGAAVVIAGFTYYIFKFPSPLMRTGCALIIAGSLFVMVQLYRRGSPGALPADLAWTDSLEFHRRELVRQRDLLRSVWRWYIGPLVPGLAVFEAGTMPQHSPWWMFLLVALFFLAVFGGIIWLNRRAATHLDRQIAELDNLKS